MEDMESTFNVTVTWRGNKYALEMASDACVKDLGDELQRLTNVKADTIRLIVPQSSKKGSKLLSPFANEHSNMSLHEASIVEGKHIKMMGVSEDEVDKVLQSAKVDLRIAGFDEEERRMRQRMSAAPRYELKLPTGPYIFCDFRTLHLPGIELNPPPSEALKRMHMLAADPGIVAVMNKHRWRVGIMTEMAPEGFVGVSPKCLLGFNKNQGEEISLRLRTDDLKGFRKYESIKKTLLHELAHMVYSDHDANFFALNKQLNEESTSLDWTKSKGHTLNGVGQIDRYDEDFFIDKNVRTSQKLGGNVSDQLASARAASVIAAHRRLSTSTASEVHEEPDPDDAVLDMHKKPDPDENSGDQNNHEPDPDDYKASSRTIEPDPDDLVAKQGKIEDETLGTEIMGYRKPDPCSNLISSAEILNMRIDEPDPDDSEVKQGTMKDETVGTEITGYGEPDPDDDLTQSGEISGMRVDEPDPDEKELQRIRDPVTIVCSHLRKAISTLKAEVNPREATASIQTIIKIISNVIKHPHEEKFKRLRKANPVIQKNIANHRAAMEILLMMGFIEDVISDEIGKMDTFFVLRRNDPGLLWLARSCLEA